MGGHQGKSHPEGQSLRRAFLRAGITDLFPAAVVRVKDRKVSFPHNLTSRKMHDTRVAVVLSNDTICANDADPLIVIAPMTHHVDVCLYTDVPVLKSSENGLLSESLVQLHLIQPLLKVDVTEKIGTLGAADWDCVIERLVWMTDRA